MDTMAGTVDARGAVVNTLEDRTVRVICALQIDKVFIFKVTQKKKTKEDQTIKKQEQESRSRTYH